MPATVDAAQLSGPRQVSPPNPLPKTLSNEFGSLFALGLGLAKAAPEAFQVAAASLPAPVATRAALDPVDTPEPQAGAPLPADVADRATLNLGPPEPQPGPAPVRVQPPRTRQPPKR
ncbi:hypothetical protein HPB49_023642 [Dermacentor silvarum]|uniref:Uncharacterized protein n=1 Tax=Dermacentor silvarum TaxID=543639 RepID=A0ACB8D0K0_DERSI|nr:hypothetical protein HPB49_023642 [Dermacentor silvarum]